MKVYVLRLNTGKKLKESINEFSLKNKVKAGIILTCVGNVTRAVLRMADTKTVKTFKDKGSYEICSLSGTLEKGYSHLHITISDRNGNVYGGHLKEDTIVGVVAEVIIGELDGIEFTRKFDKKTGFDLLEVSK